MKLIGKFLAAFFLIAAVAGLGFYFSLPTRKEIRGCITTTMYHVRLCPGSKDYVSLKQISKFMQRTVILTEDGNFFKHDGFDWESIEKNAKENFEKGAYKRGGSTITQQLAKNMFLSRDKTLWRKGVEALITLRLEKYLTKKEILERYLNVVEFGKDIYGIKAASQYYFKKSPSELGILESAFLAMVLPSPEKYSRSYYKKELTPFARRRIERIVSDMRQTGLITEDEYTKAIGQASWFFGSPPPPPPEGSDDLEDLDSALSNGDHNKAETQSIEKLQKQLIDQTPLDAPESPPADDDSSDD